MSYLVSCAERSCHRAWTKVCSWAGCNPKTPHPRFSQLKPHNLDSIIYKSKGSRRTSEARPADTNAVNGMKTLQSTLAPYVCTKHKPGLGDAKHKVTRAVMFKAEQAVQVVKNRRSVRSSTTCHELKLFLVCQSEKMNLKLLLTVHSEAGNIQQSEVRASRRVCNNLKSMRSLSYDRGHRSFAGYKFLKKH